MRSVLHNSPTLWTCAPAVPDIHRRGIFFIRRAAWPSLAAAARGRATRAESDHRGTLHRTLLVRPLHKLRLTRTSTAGKSCCLVTTAGSGEAACFGPGHGYLGLEGAFRSMVRAGQPAVGLALGPIHQPYSSRQFGKMNYEMAI